MSVFETYANRRESIQAALATLIKDMIKQSKQLHVAVVERRTADMIKNEFSNNRIKQQKVSET